MRFGLVLSALVLPLSISVVNGDGCQFGVETAKQTAQPLTDFSLQLYKKIAAENADKNIVFSPVSIALALALVEGGAASGTQAALRRFLAGGMNAADIGKYYQALQHAIRIQTEEVKLSIANGLFLDQNYTLKNEYLNKAKECFETEIQKVNFKDMEAARLRVNQWVSGKTSQRIPSLLQPGIITNRTKVILANAIHLKATWREKFRRMESLQFYKFGRDNEVQNTPFVLDLDKYAYTDDTDFHTVQIPYSDFDHDLSMFIILPKQRNGIQAVEEKLTETKFRSLATKATLRKVDLKFPKFAIRSPVKLTSILAKLGLGAIFEREADFSRMTTGPFHVSDVVHEAFIKVNENGTEAAAATAVIMGIPMSAHVGPTEGPVPFLVDHPFIFAIVHKKTESIIFMGKVLQVKEDVN